MMVCNSLSFFLLFVACLPFLIEADHHEGDQHKDRYRDESNFNNFPGVTVSLDNVKARLDSYGTDEREFFKVLSWLYRDDQEIIRSLCDNVIVDLEPTVIGIQGIKYGELRKLQSSTCLQEYEVAGISDIGTDDEIFNPIFYKGDWLSPVEGTHASASDSNGYETGTFGSMAWVQFKILTTAGPARKKRDLSEKVGNKLGNIFKILSTLGAEAFDDHCSGHQGSFIIININMKNKGTAEELKLATTDMIQPVYTELMCRKRKKSIIMGNAGWLSSVYALQQFPHSYLRKGRRGLYSELADTDYTNINLIQENDLRQVNGVHSGIDVVKDTVVSMKVGNRTMKPVFAAFHRLFDRQPEDQPPE